MNTHHNEVILATLTDAQLAALKQEAKTLGTKHINALDYQVLRQEGYVSIVEEEK